MIISDEMNRAIERLSLRARLAIALHLFAGYCERRKLAHREIYRFLNHFWRFLRVNDPVEFEEWEANRPLLLATGLGDACPPEIAKLLAKRAVSIQEFQHILMCTTEILYGSMYAATDEVGSRRYLFELSDSVGIFGVNWPNLHVFESSRWSKMHGWGKRLRPDQVAEWRKASRTANSPIKDAVDIPLDCQSK